MIQRPRARSANAWIAPMLMAFLAAGCAGGGSPQMVLPVPFYRYPNVAGQNNLRLVTILTDPGARQFEQGTPTPAGESPSHVMINPVAVATTADNTVFVLDSGRGRIYRMTYDASGQLQSTAMLPRSGRVFPSLVDLEVSPAGDLWVVDSRLKAVFRISPNGEIRDSLLSPFARPVGIAYHPLRQQMLVADLVGNAILTFDPAGRHVATYDVTTGLNVEAPSHLAVGPDGRVYVVEALSSRVRIFGDDWESVGSFGGIGDGPGYFTRPKGIVVDKDSRIYVVDALFDNIQIFSKDGQLLLTLGSTGAGVAEFWQPAGLALDSMERIYIADSFNRRVQVFSWERAVD